MRDDPRLRANRTTTVVRVLAVAAHTPAAAVHMEAVTITNVGNAYAHGRLLTRLH
jgi:long-subunit fatty acid transport protein